MLDSYISRFSDLIEEFIRSETLQVAIAPDTSLCRSSLLIVLLPDTGLSFLKIALA